jgi:hypothetical protein
MAGFLCHYALDCCAHPYIFYKSGFSDENGHLAIKAEKRHRFLEAAIDSLMAEKLGKCSAYEMNIGKRIEASRLERKAVSSCLAKCFKASYGFDREPGDYAKGMKDMSFVYKVFRDKSGRRRALVSFLGKLAKDQGASAALIPCPLDKGVDWLNSGRDAWCFPWDDSIEMSFSFMDLLQRSVDDAIIYINAFWKAVSKEMDPKIALSIIGNKNFSTGLEGTVPFKHCDKDFIKRAYGLQQRKPK